MQISVKYNNIVYVFCMINDYIYFILFYLDLYFYWEGGIRGRDHKIVGVTTTYAISPYYHRSFEF
jgi:hypothetical protein